MAFNLPEGYTDIHKYTVDHDESFHGFMDALDRQEEQTVPWRERLSARMKRTYAKQWNFCRLYGMRSSDIAKSLLKNDKKK